MADNDVLPIVVGYRTALLPDDGIRLDLQIADCPEDIPRRKFRVARHAMHRNDAKDLANMLLKTANLQESGPEVLQ